MPTTITTNTEIDQWLAENGDFEDGYLLDVTSDPLSLTVGYTTFGNYKAYSEHHIQPFRITPSGILEIAPLPMLCPSERYCFEAIETLETNAGVGIRLLTTPYFDIVAELRWLALVGQVLAKLKLSFYSLL